MQNNLAINYVMHLMANLNFIPREIKRIIGIENMMMKKTMVALSMSMMVLGLLATISNATRINDITCAEATPLLLPCVPFLKGSGGGQPSASCCSGANTIFQGATSTQNRRDLCQCFKQDVSVIGVNPDQLKQLPQLCNINLSFPLDPNIDCNS